MIAVPRSMAEVTAPWLTLAIARRCPGAVVDAVDAGPVADGTNRRATLRLSYARGSGPASVFVKMQGRPLHRVALLALGALATEVRLADSGVVLPLEHPMPYAAAFDWRRLATIAVMDDVTSGGGRPNDALRPLGMDEVRSGLEELARLHATFWDRPLPPQLGFLRPWRLGRTWAPLSRASLSRGLHRLEDAGQIALVPDGVDARNLEQQFRRSATLASIGPQTVLHGDPHPGNTYAMADHHTGFYDWQLARTGSWSHDIGYFLVSTLEIADRRAHDKELLTGYLDALRRDGVDAPGVDQGWTRYRATPAFGLATWLHTLSAGSLQPVDVCLTTLRRFATAYIDLETHQSLATNDL